MTAADQSIASAPPHAAGAAVLYRRLAVLVLLALAGIALRFVVFAWIKGGTDVTGYVHALCIWDCGWYRTIAEGGYDLAPGVRLRPGAAN